MLLLSLSPLVATTAEEPPPPQTLMGRIHHTHGPVHTMDRTELEAELQDRGAAYAPGESDDQLRLRVCNARNQLLTHRNRHAMHAQTVLYEVEQHSTIEFLSDLSLDTILTDDNAVFSEALSRKLLWQLQVQTAMGAALGLLLWRVPLLGRIQPGMGLLPCPPNRRWGFGALTVATSSLLALLAAAREYLRGLAGAPSYFGQKATAVTCREGIVEWMRETIEEQQLQLQAMQGMQGGDGAAEIPQPAELAAAATADPRFLLRKGISMPILALCCGSSIFEEVTYRGVFLHGLVTKLRLSPLVASLVSSVVFGLAHLGNDKGVALKAIYAGWTFFGGLIFGAAYLGTNGGFLLPILLHFGNNAIVFGVSVRKVARKMLHEFYEYQELAARAAAATPAAAARAARGGGGGGGGGGGATTAAAATAAANRARGGGGGGTSLFDVDRRWTRLPCARQGDELFLLHG